MDNNVKSYRKPYHRPVKRTWWMGWGFYKAYMLREGTAFLAVFVALELIVLTALPFFGIKTADAAVPAVLGNPIALLLNLVALVAACFHAYTWYNLMPKADRRFFTNKPDDTKLIPEKFYVLTLWGCTGFASLVIILFFTLA